MKRSLSNRIGVMHKSVLAYIAALTVVCAAGLDAGCRWLAVRLGRIRFWSAGGILGGEGANLSGVLIGKTGEPRQVVYRFGSDRAPSKQRNVLSGATSRFEPIFLLGAKLAEQAW
jgi:hypothetical protein